MSEQEIDFTEQSTPKEAQPEGDPSPVIEPGNELELLKAQLAKAEETISSLEDKAVRAHAEAQNIRRRAQQDVEKAHKFSIEKFAKEMVPVVDSLERALDAKVEDEAAQAVYEGIELTLKVCTDAFAKFDLVAVDPQGEPFDPAVHQAMSMQENAEMEPNTVMAVMQKGYTLSGRVVRPAMVMVTKAPAKS